MNNRERIKKMITLAVCLALCMVLPFLTGQIQQIGNALCPMHLHVMICGFAAGPPFGLLTVYWYSGRPGRAPRRLFYALYPAQLLVFALLGWLAAR